MTFRLLIKNKFNRHERNHNSLYLPNIMLNSPVTEKNLSNLFSKQFKQMFNLNHNNQAAGNNHKSLYFNKLCLILLSKNRIWRLLLRK